MGKWCLQSSTFNFDRIFFKLAGNQDMHKIPDELDFGLDRTIHFRVTCPWVKESLCFDLIFVKLAGNIGAWYAASFKWWPWVDFFYGKVNFASLCFYMGKYTFLQEKCMSFHWRYLQQMTEVTRCFCWHQNFVPKGLSAPTPRLYTHV